MLVHQLLDSKAISETVTIAPTATVSDATRLMTEKRIGAVVVSGDGNSVEGVLSERDVVAALARSGEGCLREPVSGYMTRKVETCTRATSTDELMTRMTEGRFRHMPVVEDGKLVGLVSIGDVVKAQLTKLEMEKEALEGMIKGF